MASLGAALPSAAVSKRIHNRHEAVAGRALRLMVAVVAAGVALLAVPRCVGAGGTT